VQEDVYMIEICRPRNIYGLKQFSKAWSNKFNIVVA